MRRHSSDLDGPIKVLCAIAHPIDMPPFDQTEAWQGLKDGIGDLVRSGRVSLHTPSSSSEIDIRKALDQDEHHIFHFVGYAASKGTVYCTLFLTSSEGRARSIAAGAVSNLIAKSGRSRVAIFEILGGTSSCGPLVEAVAESIDCAVLLPCLTAGLRPRVLAALYSGLAEGFSAEQIRIKLEALVPGETISVRSRNAAAPIFYPTGAEPAVTAIQPPAQVVATVQTESEPWRAKLDSKRRAGTFDVFLCHNSFDKPAVKRIGESLKQQGILPWLDIWELPPGQPWQILLEKQIDSISSAAVFVGSEGLGPWQQQELYGFLREFTERQLPVIPVLLPNAPAKPKLPVFLRAMTWVDFRLSDPDPMEQLIWGITCVHPEELSP